MNQLSTYYSKSELSSMWHLCLDFVFCVDRLFFITNPQTQISKAHESEIFESIEKLKNQEPIQYILGKTWFNDDVYEVNASVLIPRPETEELVRRVSLEIKNCPMSILDIGTGSGCIAISLKKQNPFCKVVAIDISADALKVASSNAQKLDLNKELTFINADVLDKDFYMKFEHKFDIIVSNPPYIPINEKDEIAITVQNYEPHKALFCNSDPLQFYRAIINHAAKLLNQNGLLFFEVHEKFAHEVADSLKDNCFRNIQILKDINGKDRMIQSVYGVE